MRTLRVLALLLVVLLAFITTPTYTMEPLAALVPADFVADSTLFTTVHHWVTVDLSRYTLLLTSIAALSFGLLTQPWPFAPSEQDHIGTERGRDRRQRYHQHTGRRAFGGFLLILAGCGTVAVLILGNSELWNNSIVRLEPASLTALRNGVWLASIVFYLAGSAFIAKPRPHVSEADQHAAAPATQPLQRSPKVGWSTILTLLFFAFVLYGWNLTTLPAQIDADTVETGLQASALLATAATSWFAPVNSLTTPEHPVFTLALTPTALLRWLTGDLLFGTRLAGLVAALLTTLGIWLFSVELFARRVDPPGADMPIEDNGQSLAVLATMLVLTNMALLFFSRAPITLTATAWGVLGCWALLRGIQRQDQLALGLSAILIGFAAVFHNSALAFLVTGLLWWLGFAAVRLGLLPHHLPAAGTRATNPLAIVTIGNFLLWTLGLLVLLTPFLSPIGTAVQLLLQQRPLFSSANLLSLFAGFAPPAPIYPAPLFNFILLPCIALTIGGLLFNLDRRQGWMISSWLLAALVLALLQPAGLTVWERLLPLIPAVMLGVAFAIDRFRVTLLRVGGRWSQQFITILLLGLVLWTAFHNGITYYTFAVRQQDAVSSLGHLLRRYADAQPVVILQQGTNAPQFVPTDPQLRFLTNGGSSAATDNIQFQSELATTLASGTIIFVPAAETAWLPVVEERYPGGSYLIERDHYANPLFYLYTLP